MKPSEILREAARLVESGSEAFGCRAIARASRGYIHAEKQALEYFILMARSKVALGGPWFGDWWNLKCRNHRIVALCLAAAIAESENQ